MTSLFSPDESEQDALAPNGDAAIDAALPHVGQSREVAGGRYFTNAAMPSGSLKLSHSNVRSGADDHRKCKSLGPFKEMTK